jgi:hypothetical protein
MMGSECRRAEKKLMYTDFGAGTWDIEKVGG